MPSSRVRHKSGVLLRRQNLRSHKQRHTIGQGLGFSYAKDIGEIPMESPPTRHQVVVSRLKAAIFDQYLAISQKQCKIGTYYYGMLIELVWTLIKWCYFQ